MAPIHSAAPPELTPRPRFNLGGQVSSHVSVSTSNLATTSSLYPEDASPPVLERPASVWNVGRGLAQASMLRSSSLHDTMIPEEGSPAHGFALNPQSLNPELLMREFTHDEQGTTNSPSSMFKSSFAKEVVQNVRKSMVSLQPTPVGSLHEPHGVDLRSPHLEVRSRRSRSSSANAERRYSSYTPPTPSHFSLRGKLDDSDSERDIPIGRPPMLEEKAPSFDPRALDDDDMWMSATQFMDILVKQEMAENGLDNRFERESSMGRSQSRESGQFTKFRQSMPKVSAAKSLPRLNGASRRASSFVSKMNHYSNRDANPEETHGLPTRDVLSLDQRDAKLAPSYLDQEAKTSFDKLRKTCVQMGFDYPESDWKQLRDWLLQKYAVNLGREEEFLVKNGDFFNALRQVVRNHLKRQPLSPRSPDDILKDSMKSDSGGEMEGCRSSDSGLERELAEKEREICERDRELSNCYRNLAERDTDLVRVRMECQRLLENNRELKDQIKELKLYSNPRRHLELEKEIDHLKWQLAQMESSRKTYELATARLVTFLDEVTSALQATSPAHRKLIDATKEEVSKVTKKTSRLQMQNNHLHQARYSLDSNQSFISRAESMPGLNLDSGLSSSQASLISTSTMGGMATNPSSLATESLIRRHVQRSQSTNSKRSQKLPSLQENEDDTQHYENHSLIQKIREETEEELQKAKAVVSQQQASSRRSSLHRSDSKPRVPPQKRPSFLSAKVNPDSAEDDLPPRPVKTKKPAAVASDKDSGRCSLGSVSSGRSTPNLLQVAPLNTPSATAPAKDGKTPAKEKFKSLGNLQMETALPNAPISCASEDNLEHLLSKTQKLKRSLKSLMAREKTLNITPKKNKSWKPKDEKRPPSLQLLSHTSFPGLPAFPVLAASHSSPWNC